MKHWMVGAFVLVACGGSVDAEGLDEGGGSLSMADEGASVAQASRAPEATEVDDFAVLGALLAWRRAHLRMAISEADEELQGMPAHTVTLAIRNAAERIACKGGWSRAGVVSGGSALRLVRPGQEVSVAQITLGRGGLVVEPSATRLSCAIGWSDVPAMIGVTSDELARLFARYPAGSSEDEGVVFFVQLVDGVSVAGVTVNGRLTMVEA